MRQYAQRGWLAGIVVVSFLATVAYGTPAHAGDGEWSIKFGVLFMEAYGHDQHVLTVHEIDLDPTPTVDGKAAVNLETDSATAYHASFGYHRERWALGIDALWFSTTQGVPDRTEIPAGAVDEIVYEIADRSFSSTGPGEVLYYRVLEDTDLTLWTVDLYASRTLVDREAGSLGMRAGLRLGDFDNDYRAVAGIEGVEGSRLDASSNYDLMIGPTVGVTGELRRGRNAFEGYLGQSLLLASAELTGMSREFTGPFVDAPAFTVQESIAVKEDIAIPVTELRIRWSYAVTRRISVSVGANASAWWDVSVPPGVIPGDDGDEAFHENTIVLFGMLGTVEYRF